MPTGFFFFFLFSCFTLYSLYCREARIVFKPGKNRDGYFDSKQLMAQVDRAINIFEGKANGLQGLFMFDNAPSHLRHADDCIFVTKMVKSECRSFFFVLLMSSQIPSVFGRTIQKGHACVMASIP